MPDTKSRYINSLRSILITAFVLVMLIPTIIITSYFSLSSQQTLIDVTRTDALETARFKVAAAEEAIFRIIADIIILSDSEEMRLYADQQAETTFALQEIDSFVQVYLAQRPLIYSGITILDRDGDEILSRQYRYEKGLRVPIETAPRNRGKDPIFNEPIARFSVLHDLPPVYFGELQFDETHNYRYFEVSTRLHTDDGQTIGVLVLEVAFTTIANVLIENAPGTLTYIVNSQGEFLHHPEQTSRDTSGDNLQRDRPQDGLEMLTNRTGTLYDTTDRPGWLQTFARIAPQTQRTIRWTVIYEQPISLILADVNQTQAVIVGVAIGTFLLTVMVAWGISHWLTTELRKLYNRLEQLLTERQVTILKLEESDQAKSQNITILETVATLGEEFSAILDVDQIMYKSVNRVKEIFGYYHAHVYLLDKSHENLVMMAGFGAAGAQMKAEGHKIRLDAPTSLVARSARNREVVSIDNVREEPDWLPNKLLPDTYSEMAVPIIYEGQLFDVQHDHVAGFNNSDANLLRSLANYIGVAVHNARLYEALAKNNADKDKFFSIVAHDLKGPFTPLMGNAELMVEMADILPPHEIKKMSQSMYNSTRVIFRLLDNLLTWARMQMGRMEYQPEDLHLKQIVSQTVEVLTPSAAQKGVTLHSTVRDDLLVYADPNMLDTVIRNLANNAIKFTPQDGQITLAAQANDASYIEMAVSDTGVGISAVDIDKLFKLDVQHTTAGTNKESGTGLGLLLCKELVEQNGGRIWMESELGQGTTVKFTVPVGSAQ